MLVCIECAIEALKRGEHPHAACRFEQTAAEHMASHHPQPVLPEKRQADLWFICDILNDPDHPRHFAMHELMKTGRYQL